MQLRRQLKERTSELEDKMKEMETLKRNVKVCKFQELEIEKKVYFEQTLKMKHMLGLAQDQIAYQNLRLEQVQNLESQLDSHQLNCEKAQKQSQQLAQNLQDSEALVKALRLQLKHSNLKNQQLQHRYS